MDAEADGLDLPERFTLAQAIDAGVTRYAVARLERDRKLRKISRGVYGAPVILPDGEHWRTVRIEHLHRCRDMLARHPGHAASHQTAATVYELELSLHPLADVHLTAIDRVPRSRREDRAQLHHADSVITDTILIGGIRVTALTRTVADVLRTSRLPNGVALLDGALRDGRVTSAQVRAALDEQVRWIGRPRALQALHLADPRRETWLESFSFVTLHELGVPLPVPQVEIFDEAMTFVGRVDGLLDRHGVFAEADGQEKYLLRSGEGGVSEEESRAEAMAKQQERHTRLEALGLVGVRWTTEEIRHQRDLVASRVAEALRRGDPARFTGWARVGTSLSRLPLP